MELLATEHSDEPLDDGELEGSGDDYDEWLLYILPRSFIPSWHDSSQNHEY